MIITTRYLQKNNLAVKYLQRGIINIIPLFYAHTAKYFNFL